MLCNYGCNQEAKFILKNKKACCCKSVNSCPGKKEKHNQYSTKNPMYGKIPWNKGLTKLDPRVQKYATSGSKTKLENKKPAWNKGLTKEIDIRIAQYAIRQSLIKTGKPNYKKRKDITLPKLRTKMRIASKFRQRLYCDFTFPILKRDNFKCQSCGTTKDLEVHHIKPFREIFNNSIINLELDPDLNKWTKLDLKNLENAILTSHEINLGLTVCKTCHQKIDKYRR